MDNGTVLPGYPTVDLDRTQNLCEACRILIERFGDVFDFVLIQTDTYLQEQNPCGCDARYSAGSNDVEGIGQTIFDNNGGPGTFDSGNAFNTFSDGRLQGVIYNKRIDGSPLAHEVMHRWGMNAALATGWSDGAGHYIPNTDVAGLMDLAIKDASGILVNRPDDDGLNPVDYVSNGDGSFRLVSRNGKWNPTFHPMSLYLGGFRSASGVTPVQILGGSIDPSNPDVIVPSGGTTAVTVADVVAIEGPRIPSSVDSPKEFTIGTIVVSDKPFTEAEVTFITLMLRHFESSRPYDGFGSPAFGPATLNVAAVTTALPITVEQPQPPVGEPQPPVEEPQPPVGEPSGDVLNLVSGGQFLFWSLGDNSAANVFQTVRIAWLFNTATTSWISFIPALGVTNFALVGGAVLWVVVDFATSIPLSNGPPS